MACPVGQVQHSVADKGRAAILAHGGKDCGDICLFCVAGDFCVKERKAEKIELFIKNVCLEDRHQASLAVLVQGTVGNCPVPAPCASGPPGSLGRGNRDGLLRRLVRQPVLSWIKRQHIHPAAIPFGFRHPTARPVFVTR